jgi:hypothetical protein
MPKLNHYFTRLTPNFNDWNKPSGRDGKCNASDPTKPLYEEMRGFGWEEWLFEEYFENLSNPEYVCNGFVEAFNQKNKDKEHVDRLYLYTKLCNNNMGYKPGYYFVGYIDNVERIDPIPKLHNEVQADLIAVDLNHNGFLPMLPFAKNISFKVKDVHVKFPLVYKQPIRLNRGQFRFSLYDLNDHPNFLTTINDSQ